MVITVKTRVITVKTMVITVKTRAINLHPLKESNNGEKQPTHINQPGWKRIAKLRGSNIC